MSQTQGNVFGFLDHVRARPEMYIRNRSLQNLEDVVCGYYSALHQHGIEEEVPHMNGHFLSWLQYRKGWSTSRGFAVAIESHHRGPAKAFAAFFKLVDEYRQLRLEALAVARLTKRHHATGTRVKYGFDDLIEKPAGVEVIRYSPEPLHFLRLRYADRLQDMALLHRDLDYSTSIRDAKQWAADEFLTTEDDWTPRARKRRGK